MPYYTPILDLDDGQEEELGLQLNRGINWLHGNLISHSDIKERNLVFDEKQGRLLIIDLCHEPSVSDSCFCPNSVS